mgnify:CR=1 FL=1
MARPDAPVQLYTVERAAGRARCSDPGFATQQLAPAARGAATLRATTGDRRRPQGFGRSDKPFDERYAASDQAELLAQLILDRDLHNLTIVGHSFGGGIALLLALEADTRLHGRIATLVLPSDTIAYPQAIPVFFKLLDRACSPRSSGCASAPPSVQIQMALRIAYFDNSKIGDDEIEAYAEPMKTAAGKHALIH